MLLFVITKNKIKSRRKTLQESTTKKSPDFCDVFNEIQLLAFTLIYQYAQFLQQMDYFQKYRQSKKDESRL